MRGSLIGSTLLLAAMLGIGTLAPACHKRVVVAPAAAPDLEARADAEARGAVKNPERLGGAMRGLATERDGYTDFQVALDEGTCYTFAYAGDASVEKFSIYLWDPSEKRVETQRSKPSSGYVSHCALKSGTYRLQGKVSEGAGHFVMVMYKPSKGDKPSGAIASTSGTVTAPPVGTGNVSTMTDSEKKSTARVAFSEGLALQEKGDCAGALPKFQTAQRLFDAPTQLLHIAQCQVELKQLVEAQESYEVLSRENLQPGASDAFKQAKETANKELPGLRGRIPTLKITVAPANAPGLIVVVNGRTIANDALGIGRPVNPGPYKIAASAKGYKAFNLDLDLKEGESKPADIKLTK